MGSEGVKAENDFIEYFHKPAFRKLFVNGLNFYAMRIPTAFMELMEKEVPNMATLRGSSGGYRHIRVVEGEEGISLEDGWEKFREDNNLSSGDVLLFRYSGHWCFYVEIFGPDGLEKKMQQRNLNILSKMKKSQVLNRKKVANSAANQETGHCSVPRRKSGRPRKNWTMLLSPKKQRQRSYTFVSGLEGKSGYQKRKYGNQNDPASTPDFSEFENDSGLMVLELEETRRSKRPSKKPDYLKHFVES